MPGEEHAPHRLRSNRAHSHAASSRLRSKVSLGDLAVDVGLGGAIFAVPFLMGGRQALGQLVLVVAACWSAIAWLLFRQLPSKTRWHWTGAEALILAGSLLVVLQITPLKSETRNWLSPHIAEILPSWTDGGESILGLGEWTQLSLSPAASRAALITYVAYALLFVVTAQRIRRIEDVERFLRWICVSVTAMATFGILQLLTSNGKFFWFYTHPFTDTNGAAKGAFTNRNHFAQFLALGVGPLIWWIVTKLRHRQTGFQSGSSRHSRRAPGEVTAAAGVLVLALGIVIFSGALSLSRAGTVVIFAAAVISLTILYFSGQVSGKLLAGIAAFGTLLVAFLFVYGYDSVSKRFESWESPPRLLIWQANLGVLADFPIFGTGSGSHRESHQIYLANPLPDREFTHAECSYLQVASENGWIGFSLLVIGIGFCFYWCVRGMANSRSTRTTMAYSAIIASLIAQLLHATVDFTWYAPALVVVALTLVVCACRLYQMDRAAESAPAAHEKAGGGILQRMACAFCLAGLLIMSPCMIQAKLPPLRAEPYWQEYLRLTFGKDEMDEEPGVNKTGMKLLALAKAAHADPDNPRIQLRMAMGYISLFHILQRNSENMMTLAQFRDAALASVFESPKQRDDWLDAAIGKNRKYLQKALFHTRRALALCPLQGKGYVYLAELGFLEGAGHDLIDSCVKQALAVRPYDAQVLFAAGREAWIKGDYDVAFGYWRDAFHQDEVYENRILDLLAGIVGAQSIIDKFDPSWESLMRMRDRYHEHGSPEDYTVILKRFAEKSVEQAGELDRNEAIGSYLYGHHAYVELGDVENSLNCLKMALAIGPNSYRVRYAVGVWFFKQEKFAEAADHLAWCARLKPEDKTLRRLADVAMKEKLRDPAVRLGADPSFNRARTR